MPTTITALPTPPSRSDPANFASRGDAFLGALPTFATEVNTVALEINTNASTASTAATNASLSEIAAEAAQAAAEAASNATVWVSGITYSTGDVRWSPIDFASYRRKTNGAGTTDPSADTTNWASLGSSSGLVLLSTYNAAGASAVDIETGIGSTYDDYLIVMEDIVTSSASQLELRVKKSGAYITGSSYKQQYRTDTGSGTYYANTKFGPTGLGTAGTSIVSGRTNIMASNTAGKTTFEMYWGYIDGSSGGFTQSFGFETTSAVLQGVRFYVSSGTFTSGTFRLYGFAK